MSEMKVKLSQLASDVPRPSVLQNGGFEQWPFGTTGLPSPGFGPANWYNGGSLTVVRDSANADVAQGGTYCAAVTSTVAGAELQHYAIDSVNRGLGPVIESGMIGRVHTFAMRVKTAVANGCRLCVYDSVSGRTLFSPYHNGDGTWQTLSMQYTAPVGATNIIPMARFDVNGVYYLDNAVMVPGAAVANYHPFAGLPDVISNVHLGSDAARLNLFPNGGVERWQRGNGPFTANAAFGADRWQCYPGAPSTYSFSRITSTIGSSGYSGQIVYTHGGGGSLYVVNSLEEYNQLAGKMLSVKITLKSTVAGTVKVGFQDGSGWRWGAYNVGVGVETLTFAGLVALGQASTVIQVGMTMDIASATVEFNDAVVNVGAIASDYQPLSPADDMARCLRYYELLSQGSSFFPRSSGYNGGAAGQGYPTPVSYAAKKPSSPTVTKTGTWTVANTGQPTIAGSDQNGAVVQFVASATGSWDSYPGGVGAGVSAESNP